MKNKLVKRLTAIASVSILTLSLFVGCGDSTGKVGQNGKVTLFNWGDYIDPELIKQFEKETLIDVILENYDTNEIMYEKIKSTPGTYDLIIPSDYMIQKMINEDLLEEINYDNIPNYANIDSKYKNLAYDESNKYSIPYTWGVIGLLYDADVVTENVDSWDILWNEKYAKQIFMYDSYRDTFVAPLKKLGYSLNTNSESEINAAKDLLIKQAPLVQALVVDDIKTLLVNGDGALAPVWAGDAMYIMNEAPDKNFKFVVPKEGSNIYFDAMAIPKGAPNKENAEKLINFLLDAEVGKQNSEYIGYSTPNKAAFELLDDETKNNKTAYPDQEVLDKCEVFKDLPKETLNIYQKVWDEYKLKFK